MKLNYQSAQKRGRSNDRSLERFKHLNRLNAFIYF